MLLPQLAQILQETLNLTRYASSPFVLGGRPDSIRQWLAVLREQLVALAAKIDAASANLERAGKDDDWTDTEQVLSLEWITRNYPNESAAVQAALRRAWRDGQRHITQASPPAPAGNLTSRSICDD